MLYCLNAWDVCINATEQPHRHNLKYSTLLNVPTHTANIFYRPVQDLPSLCSEYPGSHEHRKLPSVLVHDWAHGDDVHSLISVMWVEWYSDDICVTRQPW